MKSIISILIISVLATASTPSSQKNKLGIMMLGDSWAFLICLHNSMEKALLDSGLNSHLKERIKVYGCMQTVSLGSDTKDWLENDNFNNIYKILKEHPNIKAVYMSLGGNDFMSKWKSKMNPSETHDVFKKIASNIKVIIYKIQQLRPDMEFIISGYDYPNFVNYTHVRGYNNLFRRMGSPNPKILNRGLIDFTKVMSELMPSKHIEFIHHLGLMHYYFGNKTFSLKKKMTAHPSNISPAWNRSLYGGVEAYPASQQSMFKIPFIFSDPFHLGHKGFDLVLKHSMDSGLKELLQKLLINDQKRCQSEIRMSWDQPA